MAFQCFDLERTWWRLFQKRVVCTTFDIYDFISTNDVFLEYPSSGTFLEYPSIGTFLEYPSLGTFLEYPSSGTFLEYPSSGTFLEYPSSGTFEVNRFESQIMQKSLRAWKSKGLKWIETNELNKLIAKESAFYLCTLFVCYILFIIYLQTIRKSLLSRNSGAYPKNSKIKFERKLGTYCVHIHVALIC